MFTFHTGTYTEGTLSVLVVAHRLRDSRLHMDCIQNVMDSASDSSTAHASIMGYLLKVIANH